MARTLKCGCLGFPRVSGDEPDAATDFIRWTLFSPRERG